MSIRLHSHCTGRGPRGQRVLLVFFFFLPTVLGSNGGTYSTLGSKIPCPITVIPPPCLSFSVATCTLQTQWDGFIPTWTQTVAWDCRQLHHMRRNERGKSGALGIGHPAELREDVRKRKNQSWADSSRPAMGSDGDARAVPRG